MHGFCSRSETTQTPRSRSDRALAIQNDKPEPEVLHHAGDIYYMNGDHKAAVEFWEKALKLDPDNALLRKKVKEKTHFYE